MLLELLDGQGVFTSKLLSMETCDRLTKISNKLYRSMMSGNAQCMILHARASPQIPKDEDGDRA